MLDKTLLFFFVFFESIISFLLLFFRILQYPRRTDDKTGFQLDTYPGFNDNITIFDRNYTSDENLKRVKVHTDEEKEPKLYLYFVPVFVVVGSAISMAVIVLIAQIGFFAYTIYKLRKAHP